MSSSSFFSRKVVQPRVQKAAEEFAQQWVVEETQDQTGVKIPTPPTFGGGLATIFHKRFFSKPKSVHENPSATDHERNQYLANGHQPEDASDLANIGRPRSLNGVLRVTRKSPEPSRDVTTLLSIDTLLKDLPQAHVNLRNAQEDLRRAEELASQPISAFLKKENQ